MSEMDIEDYLVVFRRRLGQKRDALLASIVPKQKGICQWKECDQPVTAQVQFGKLDNVKECQFCWYHYASVRSAVLDLAKYELPEQ